MLLFLWAYAAQLAVTKISANDDGLVLKVDEIGDGKLFMLKTQIKIASSKRMF